MGGGPRAQPPRWGTILSAAAFAALALYLFLPIARCLDECMVDYVALRGAELGTIELTDARLNTWILAWVQRALLADPTALFDANAFYPVPDALTQSEHLLSVAVLTMPLRLFTSNPLLVHQVALMLSTLLLALTTFALVRWLTGSTFASFVAGAAAALMPWRLSELAHVQLLNAQWMPLVWLYLGRILCGERRRRDAAWLSLALSLQLLSSFYLAYHVMLSGVVLILVLWMRTPPQRGTTAALARGCAAPLALLLLVAVPYLRWNAGPGFHAVGVLFDSVAPADALSMLRPRLAAGLALVYPVPVSYEIPLAVFGAAIFAFLRCGGSDDADAERRCRAFAWALGAVCVASFIMMLGRELRVGELSVKLPAHWASLIVPGFAKLRSPLRWAIPIGVALPVLAGMGIARLEWCGAVRAGARLRLGALRGALVLAFTLGLATAPIPARDGWEHLRERQRGYRALAALPPGPAIEIPWPLQPDHDIVAASQYLLASTLHWRPLANGTSGYVPISYPLLRQIAHGLPDASALRGVQQLADMRWIVVHLDALDAATRSAWAEAGRSGRLRRAHSDAATWIFEIPDWERGGRFMEALIAPGARATTFAGLSRAPLELPESAGTLALGALAPFEFAGDLRAPALVEVTIENRSEQPWPGLDVQTEGLVRLRYAFVAADGSEVLTETAALAADLPAHSTSALRVPIAPPARAGRFRLRIDLVQRLAGEDRALPIEPVEREVEVRSRGRVAPTDRVSSGG
jgi:hypothetical protein